LPSWEKLSKELAGQPVRLLAVAVRDSRTDLRTLVAREGLSLPIFLDEQGDSAARWGVKALPTAIYLDQEGRIAGRFVGPHRWDRETLLKLAGHGS